MEYYWYNYNITDNRTENDIRTKRAVDTDITTTTALPVTTETPISDEDIFYEVSSFSTVCRYWDPYLSEWISNGCEVIKLVLVALQLQCI